MITKLGLVLGASMLMSTSAFAFEATIEATPTLPIVRGRTNLPDGTALSIIIGRKANQWSDSRSVTVKGGQFVSPPFSKSADPLSPGVYSVEIMGTASSDWSGTAVVPDEMFGGKRIDLKLQATMPGKVDPQGDARRVIDNTMIFKQEAAETCLFSHRDDASLADCIRRGFADAARKSATWGDPR